MNMKRVFAPTSREAARLVREQLGPDAVILSNRRIEGGVEIVAAMDYDDSLFAEGGTPESPLDQSRNSDQPQTGERPPSQVSPNASTVPSRAPDRTVNEIPERTADGTTGTSTGDFDRIGRELADLRRLVEHQLNGFAWAGFSLDRPNDAEILETLTDIGIEVEHCKQLLEHAGGYSDVPSALDGLRDQLARELPSLNDELLTVGGMFAVVGPTGVGKTTTIAKLAARFTLSHGPGRVGLVTTDSFRIGAFDQLRTFARILNIPVQLARSPDELAKSLDGFSDRDLVLVDTAGMSQRDVHLAEQFAVIQSSGERLRAYLVLAANAQAQALDEACESFGQVPLSGLIFTKLDECRRLGGALSVAWRRRLPIAYTSDGQRVPDDIQAVSTRGLVDLAWNLAAGGATGAARETMALRFGADVVNIRG